MTSIRSKWVLAQLATHLPAGRVLCLNAEDLPRTLPTVRDDITPLVFSTRREAWLPPHLPEVSSAVVGWSPSKDLMRMQFAMLAETLGVGTPVLAYGPGEAGIASAQRVMAEHYSRIEKLAFGSHAQLWRGDLAVSRPVRGLKAWEKHITVEVAGQVMRLVSLPGVFSHGELDEGTRLLLEHLPPFPARARVHDFGCGCGVIGAWLLVRQPSLAVTFSDIDALCFAATKATLAANRLSAALPIHLESGLPSGLDPVDVMISNPPFHQGKDVDLSVTNTLIRSASKKLRAGGRLILVANRFLPYKAEMERHIGPTRFLAETRHFRVLEATRG